MRLKIREGELTCLVAGSYLDIANDQYTPERTRRFLILHAEQMLNDSKHELAKIRKMI